MNLVILRLLKEYLYAEMHLDEVPTCDVYAMRKKLWQLVKDMDETTR